MGFKLPDSFYEKQQEIYDKKYITYQDKEIHVSELEDKSVTMEMKNRMRMNSYAQDDLPPKLTDEALIETTKYYVSNCHTPRFPCATYNESIIHKLVPELLKRLEENQKEIDNLNKAKSVIAKSLEEWKDCALKLMKQ